MIALETKSKLGKSPKKPQVELREDSDDEGLESEYDSDNLESEAPELRSRDNETMDSESNSQSDNDNSGKMKTEGNPGWADVMQKILRTNKPKRKKTLVLSKAKKLCDVVKKEEKEELSFDIEKVKDEVKVEGEESKEIVPTTEESLAQPKRRRKDNLGIRVKPNIADRERERLLQKIATKGVVQLFNAVKQQQSEINQKLSEAGPLERKREQVMKSIDKRAFLDVLMGGSKSIQVDNAVKDEKQQKDQHKDDKVWNVLREDFVMGAKLKDWDRNSAEEDSSAPEDMDSDGQN